MEIKISKRKFTALLTFSFVFFSSLIGTLLLIDNFQNFPSLGMTIFYTIVGIGLILLFRLFSIKINLNKLSISALILYFGISLSFITSAKIDQHALWQFSIFVILPFLIVSLLSDKFSKIITSYLYNIPTYIYEKLVGPFILFEKFKDEFGKIKVSKDLFLEITKSILLFIFVGLPVIFVILILLASASPSFASLFRPILEFVYNLFKIEISFITLMRLVFFVFLFFYLAGEVSFIKSFKNRVIDKSLLSHDYNFAKYVLRFVVVFLIILNVIFGIFAVIDINTDLVGGIENHRENLLSKGFDSYSSYAVSRFTEIIIVTVINLAIIYFIEKYLESKFPKYNKVLKINVLLLLLANLMLVFSAFQRLNLYVSGYGYTEKRFDSMLILIVITIISLVLILSLFRNKLKEGLELSFVVASIGIVSILILPTTYLVYKLNYNLHSQGKIVVYDPKYGANYNDRYFGFSGYDKNEDQNDGLEIKDIREWYIRY